MFEFHCPPYCSKKGHSCCWSTCLLICPLDFLSNSELSVLQKLNNYMVNVLAEFFVSFSCQMKVIKHVLMAYDAITSNKAWIRVQVNWIGDSVNGFLQCVVYLEVFLTKAVWLFSSRKQTLKTKNNNDNQSSMGCV